MSEEREEQILHERRTTFSYFLSMLLGTVFISLHFLYTFYLQMGDPFYKLIHLMLSFGLVMTILGFALINKNFLRSLLKVISGILAVIHVYGSLALFDFMGVLMMMWYGVSLFLLLIAFKWLRESELGGETSSHLRKNFTYYLSMVIGIAFFLLFMGYTLSITLIDPFYKMILLDVSILLLVTSLGFAYLKTRRARIAMTVVSGSLAGVHGYLSIALFTGAGVYMFGWLGFSVLLIFAAFNWFKE